MNVVRAFVRLRVPEVSEMTMRRLCSKSRLFTGLYNFLDHDVRSLARIHECPLYAHSDSIPRNNLITFQSVCCDESHNLSATALLAMNENGLSSPSLRL